MCAEHRRHARRILPPRITLTIPTNKRISQADSPRRPRCSNRMTCPCRARRVRHRCRPSVNRYRPLRTVPPRVMTIEQVRTRRSTVRRSPPTTRYARHRTASSTVNRRRTRSRSTFTLGITYISDRADRRVLTSWIRIA